MPLKRPRDETACFLFGGGNTFACSYFGNFLCFLLRDYHGFANLGNLALSAFHELGAVFAAWQGGKFAQRFGCLTLPQTGFARMCLSLLAGWFLPSLPTQMVVLAVWTVSIFLTWPALEALASVAEDITTPTATNSAPA